MQLPHASAGTVPQVANPVHFSATPISYHRAPPVLGQHTSEILRDVLSLDDGHIADLQRNKVI